MGLERVQQNQKRGQGTSELEQQEADYGELCSFMLFLRFLSACYVLCIVPYADMN